MEHKIFIDYDDEFKYYYDEEELIAEELKKTI